MGLWVDNRHPEYGTSKGKRAFTRDQYTGDALEVSVREAEIMKDPAFDAGDKTASQPLLTKENTPGLKHISRVNLTGSPKAFANGTYLKRRALGESAAAFRERVSITRFPSHMPTLIEAYVGGVAAVEENWKRTWGAPLGEPSDPASTAFKMWHDIDGTGRNWRSAHNRAGTNLIVDDVFWSLTELGSADYPRTHIIDPDRIVDWHDEDGIPIWALLHEEVLERDDFHVAPVLVDYFKEYTVDGWARYKVEGEGKDRQLVLIESEDWPNPFWSTGSMKRKRLPFTRFKLSDIMGRYVGHQMAQDHNALYNLLSDARWNFRVINHPRLVMKEGNRDDFLTALADLAAGANGLLGQWEYASPNPENGASAYKVFSEEVKQFYISNHQRMNGSNIERSATEIAYNEAAGRTSFLSIMTDALDEIENDHLFLSEQLMAPNDPDSWYSSRVERSRQFKPIDIDALVARQATAYGTVVNSLPAEIALRIARDGITDGIIEEIAALGQDNAVEEDL